MKLLQILETVKSKTSLKGRTYKISSIIALIILGTLCGQNSIKSIARFGERLTKPQRKKLGYTDSMPSSSTLYYTLKAVDSDDLAKKLLAFSKITINNKLIDIDGKTIRGSKRQNCDAHHMLSAFARDSRMMLAQLPVKGAVGEITGCIELLNKLQLKNNIIVGDAIFTQKNICNKIIQKKSNFFINVKNNQKNFKKQICHAFEKKIKPIRSYKEEIVKKHGRIEERNIEIMNVPNKYFSEWLDVKQIARINKNRFIKINGEWKNKSTTNYFAMSFNRRVANIQKILSISRGHWSIENKLHWVRDKIFAEDMHNLSNVNSCNIMSNIRSFVIHRTCKKYQNIKAAIEIFAHKAHLGFKVLNL